MNRKLFRKLGLGGALAAGLAGAATLAAVPTPASACGGLFCSSANPVNQAAEQIIFVDNPDGSVTAVIQILYEGPAHKFAWVLPVPGNPTPSVSSNQAFATLKAATNPLYQLTTTFEDGCTGGRGAFGNSAGSAGASATPPSASEDGGPSVSVLASGAIGPYDFTTIAVDPAFKDPAGAAVQWLEDNSFDVGMLGPEVLGPYLANGLNLIAFKLSKDSGTGSIRPVMLTYTDAMPSIPIRPTAVAANDDMGVMVFLLSDARGIPQNYKALELNEALIDWFNPNNNYNTVVSTAADEAMGQGFVTEFAGPHANTGIQVFPDWQRQMWTDFQNAQHADAFQMISDASNIWGGWDGFDDALFDAVTLPTDVAFADFKNCVRCYADDPAFTFSTSIFLRRLYEMVIKPMADTQALFDARPYLTRLYTTMSAEEMTMDPVFAFNPDLDDVSNQHTAEQKLGCGKDGDPFAATAPWTVKLAQGDVVRGSGQGRIWPIKVDDQPAALRILQFGTSGEGKVLDDRSKAISAMITAANPPAASGSPKPTGSAGSGGTGGSSVTPGSKPTAPGLAGTGGPNAIDETASSEDDSGCNVAHSTGSDALSLLLLAGLALLRRRRS